MLSHVLGSLSSGFLSPTIQPFLYSQVACLIPVMHKLFFIQFNLNSVKIGLILFIIPFWYTRSAIITGLVADKVVSHSVKAITASFETRYAMLIYLQLQGYRWFSLVVCGAGFVLFGPAEFISTP